MSKLGKRERERKERQRRRFIKKWEHGVTVATVS